MQQIYKDALTKAISKAGITDKSTIAMIFAQCHYESENFSVFEENFNYHPAGLLKTFPKRVTSMQMANTLCAKGAQAIANFVYAGRYGNGNEESGDGWRYRGHGLTMLTFKANYIAASKFLGLDLVNHPELASTPDGAATIAVAYFTRRPALMDYAAQGNCEECTNIINGGDNGAAEREALYHRYMAA